MARTADPVPTIPLRTIGFAGGVNMRDSANQLAPDEMKASENGVLDEKGTWTKRTGCISNGTFGSAADRIISMYTFYRGESAPQVLIQTSGGALYYTNDPTANPVTWVLIVSGISGTARMSFETFNGKCYFSNGVDDYASWSGSAYATYPSAPKGKYLRLWKDTMWVSGIIGLPDRVYSSNPGDAETFGVAAWVDIAKGDGDKVIGLGTDGLFLAVFKRSRYMIIYDPGLFSNRVVDFEKGCESHFSIVQFESEIYFLSRRGICKFDANGPADFVSWKLDPLFDPAVLNFSALETVYAYTVGNRIGWALPEFGSPTPTVQLEYYPRLVQYVRTGGFNSRPVSPFVFHRMPASVFTRFRSGAVEYLYGGKNTENKFLYLFAPVGTDDTVAFAAVMETSAFDFGSPTKTKYIRRVRFLGRGKVYVQFRRNFQTAILNTLLVNLSAAVDLWNTGELWGSGTWGPDSLLKEAEVKPDVYGRAISMRFTDTETTVSPRSVSVGSREVSLTVGSWGISGCLIEAELLGQRD